MWRLTGVLQAAAVALSLVRMNVAQAAEEQVDVQIPAGPLPQALKRLAASTGLQLLYDPALVIGRSTAGASGHMTRSQALESVLESNGIDFKFTAKDAVALYQHAQQTPAAARSNLPAPTQQQTPEASQRTVTVSTDRSQDEYYANGSPTALKMPSAVLTTPLAYQAIGEQTLRDQGAARLEDVLEDVSSIETGPDGQTALGFGIRGFFTYQYYVDGVRVSPDLHHDGFRDLADVERVDVIKGPASTLYGRTEPGGLINIVTKQPLNYAYQSVEQQIGSFYRRTQFDSGGPLSANGSIRYRFNAAYEDGHSFRQLANHRYLLAPVVSWDLTPTSQLTTYAEYLKSKDPTDEGLPVIGSRLPPVPVTRRIDDGGDVNTTDMRLGVKGASILVDGWTLRYHVDGRWLRTPHSAQFGVADNGVRPNSCNPQDCPVDRKLFAIPVSTGRTWFATTSLSGTVSTGPLKHQLMTGLEYFDVRGHDEWLFGGALNYPIDLFQPVSEALPAQALRNPRRVFEHTTEEAWSSIFLQDSIELPANVFLLAGARYDHVREWLETATGVPPAESSRDSRWDNAFKRRVGVLWQPLSTLGLYANYAEDFGISTGIYGIGLAGPGMLLPPESAREWEAGIKREFLDGGVQTSVAYYELTKTNIPQSSYGPLLTSQTFRTLTGAARTSGLEADAQGEIAPNLQLIASYAYMSSRILSVDVGKRLYGVPRHGGSLWVTYRPFWQGLKVGLGVVARTTREGDNANDYQLPGFTRWNMLAAYHWHRVSLQLNVNNLFNEHSYESIGGTLSVMPGYPRRWITSIRVEF
jgi:iron complex outermembrane recepter protein